jgi:hypothetical protein
MEMYTVESSAIRAVGYDQRARLLRIVFAQGNMHDYAGVPRDVFDAFLKADSMGAFFNREIRDRYD